MQHWCEKYARPAIFKRQTAENIFHRRCCRPSRATPYKQLRSYITWYFAWMKFWKAKQKYDIRHSAIQHACRYQYHGHHPSETHKVHSTILHAQICYDYAWAAFRRWCNNSWRPFLGNKKGQSVEHPFFSNYCSTLKRNQIDMNHKKTRKNDIDLKTNWLCNIILLSIANANNIVFAFA